MNVPNLFEFLFGEFQVDKGDAGMWVLCATQITHTLCKT